LRFQTKKKNLIIDDAVTWLVETKALRDAWDPWHASILECPVQTLKPMPRLYPRKADLSFVSQAVASVKISGVGGLIRWFHGHVMREHASLLNSADAYALAKDLTMMVTRLTKVFDDVPEFQPLNEHSLTAGDLLLYSFMVDFQDGTSSKTIVVHPRTRGTPLYLSCLRSVRTSRKKIRMFACRSAHLVYERFY